jgi:RNA polymerase sigma factor (sigma-70 family)
MNRDPGERSDEDLLRSAARGDDAAFIAYCDGKLPGIRHFFVRALRRKWEAASVDQVEAFLQSAIDWATCPLDRRAEPLPAMWPPEDQRKHVLRWLRLGSAGELLRRVVAENQPAFRDKPAFVAFSSLALPDLRNTLMALLRRWRIPPDLADDFVQDILTSTIRRLQQHQDKTSDQDEEPLWPGWFVVLAKNKARDWLKKHRGPLELPAGALTEIPAPPGEMEFTDREEVDQSELADVLARPDDTDLTRNLDRVRLAFDALEAADHRLLMRLVVEGQTPKQVAIALKIDPAEVNARHVRALNRLKALLDETKVRAALQALENEKRPLREDDRSLIVRVLLEGKPPPRAKNEAGQWSAEYKRYKRALKRLRDKLEPGAAGST